MKVYSDYLFTLLETLLKGRPVWLTIYENSDEKKVKGLVSWSVVRKNKKLLIERLYRPDRYYRPIGRRYVSIEAFLVEIERNYTSSSFVSPIDDIPFNK